MARADSLSYALSGTGVAIRGGIYALVSNAVGGQLQMMAPDNSSWVPVATVDVPATPISAINGSISPIYLPAGQVKLVTGSGWLVGIG